MLSSNRQIAAQTFTACEDTLRAEAEDEAVGVLPSLCMAPRIDLVLQVAAEWRSWEQRRKHDGGAPPPAGAPEAERAAWAAAGAKECRRFFYIVCSAGDDVSSASLRVIPVRALVATLERHAARGELSLCRFFTTVEGGGAFWYEARRFNLRRGAAPGGRACPAGPSNTFAAGADDAAGGADAAFLPHIDYVLTARFGSRAQLDAFAACPAVAALLEGDARAPLRAAWAAAMEVAPARDATAAP